MSYFPFWSSTSLSPSLVFPLFTTTPVFDRVTNRYDDNVQWNRVSSYRTGSVPWVGEGTQTYTCVCVRILCVCHVDLCKDGVSVRRRPLGRHKPYLKTVVRGLHSFPFKWRTVRVVNLHIDHVSDTTHKQAIYSLRILVSV